MQTQRKALCERLKSKYANHWISVYIGYECNNPSIITDPEIWSEGIYFSWYRPDRSSKQFNDVLCPEGEVNQETPLMTQREDSIPNDESFVFPVNHMSKFQLYNIFNDSNNRTKHCLNENYCERYLTILSN